MKILFVSLGCDKNLVDSEVMLGLLRDRGHEITNEESQAEIVVVNTVCTVPRLFSVKYPIGARLS